MRRSNFLRSLAVAIASPAVALSVVPVGTVIVNNRPTIREIVNKLEDKSIAKRIQRLIPNDCLSYRISNTPSYIGSNMLDSPDRMIYIALTVVAISTGDGNYRIIANVLSDCMFCLKHDVVKYSQETRDKYRRILDEDLSRVEKEILGI